MTFFRWLFDRTFLHAYWEQEPPEWLMVDKWRDKQGFGKPQPVTKKKCKVCHTIVWSNNNHSICGSLRCWMKGEAK